MKCGLCYVLIVCSFLLTSSSFAAEKKRDILFDLQQLIVSYDFYANKNEIVDKEFLQEVVDQFGKGAWNESAELKQKKQSVYGKGIEALAKKVTKEICEKGSANISCVDKGKNKWILLYKSDEVEASELVEGVLVNIYKLDGESSLLSHTAFNKGRKTLVATYTDCSYNEKYFDRDGKNRIMYAGNDTRIPNKPIDNENAEKSSINESLFSKLKENIKKRITCPPPNTPTTLKFSNLKFWKTLEEECLSATEPDPILCAYAAAKSPLKFKYNNELKTKYLDIGCRADILWACGEYYRLFVENKSAANNVETPDIVSAGVACTIPQNEGLLTSASEEITFILILEKAYDNGQGATNYFLDLALEYKKAGRDSDANKIIENECVIKHSPFCANELMYPEARKKLESMFSVLKGIPVVSSYVGGRLENSNLLDVDSFLLEMADDLCEESVFFINRLDNYDRLRGFAKGYVNDFMDTSSEPKELLVF